MRLSAVLKQLAERALQAEQEAQREFADALQHAQEMTAMQQISSQCESSLHATGDWTHRTITPFRISVKSQLNAGREALNTRASCVTIIGK